MPNSETPQASGPLFKSLAHELECLCAETVVYDDGEQFRNAVRQNISDFVCDVSASLLAATPGHRDDERLQIEPVGYGCLVAGQHDKGHRRGKMAPIGGKPTVVMPDLAARAIRDAFSHVAQDEDPIKKSKHFVSVGYRELRQSVVDLTMETYKCLSGATGVDSLRG